MIKNGKMICWLMMMMILIIMMTRSGVGTIYYINGDRYVGSWKQDKATGNGTYHYKNGDR